MGEEDRADCTEAAVVTREIPGRGPASKCQRIKKCLIRANLMHDPGNKQYEPSKSNIDNCRSPLIFSNSMSSSGD